MPMIWNATADAKLLLAIVQVYDVKVSGEKLKEVAELMGPECTAKALTHRLQKIRSMAKDGEDGSTTQDTNAEKPKAAPKAAKASGAPKKARGGKKAAAEKTSSPAGSEEKYATPPESGRAKPGGTKRDYAKLAGEDEDDDGLSKKVKIEVGEDIGEGLRQGMGDD